MPTKAELAEELRKARKDQDAVVRILADEGFDDDEARVAALNRLGHDAPAFLDDDASDGEDDGEDWDDD